MVPYFPYSLGILQGFHFLLLPLIKISKTNFILKFEKSNVIKFPLNFRSKLFHEDIARQLMKKYGPVFTKYTGSQPIVYVCNYELATEVYRNNVFAGRPIVHTEFTRPSDDKIGILFTDYGEAYKSLKRVGLTAINKFAGNDRLVDVVVDCVDSMVETIVKREGIDKPFVPNEYISMIFLNILSSCAWGQSYNFDDPELKLMRYFIHDFALETNDKLKQWEGSALFRFLDRKLIAKQLQTMSDHQNLMIEKFVNHYIDYNQEIDRDFCDAFISAKNDAINSGGKAGGGSGAGAAQYLTDANLTMSIYDMFIAGAEGTEMTFRWLTLFMAYYPAMQSRLRQEVDTVIGDRLPRHEDKHQCHYTMAFISEILRYRTIVSDGELHKVRADNTKLGNHIIPKDTIVRVYQGIVMKNDDTNYWTRGLDFLPERFLDPLDGHYRKPSPAYNPFGSGARKCVGERFAYAEIFLVLVRLLQRTNRYDIVLDSNDGVGINPAINDFCVPFDFAIRFRHKKLIN
ncbi:steroid 17-alpha-hydroxylase/17,20 lyase-like [Oppia nitens]|uniref:steroid 17-alpha-hydroxylase/17,20 lyase-like n=1 Tax=Oppia nitens TaxID=1686743 RepID=UPI0023DBFF6C|nr:steroid 17-alpha-hydroxylase/17,20 lyase-like [Oppia nitens]